MSTLRWERASHGNLPRDAIPGGCTNSRETLFVGRSHESGDLLPGKVHGSHRCLYIAYGGKEKKHEHYEVLVNPGNKEQLLWAPGRDGQVPTGAIVAGHTRSGETVYVGRATHSGEQLPGKLHPSHKCVYVPWGGGEHAHKNYEVLVCKHVNPPSK